MVKYVLLLERYAKIRESAFDFLYSFFTKPVNLKKVSVGTDVSIVQEGIPDMIPAEACYLGWQESLTLLAKLVEAEIPD